MRKEGLNVLLGKPQVVDIIKKFGLSIKTEIRKILKMAWRNDIKVNVFNKILIREDGRKRRYQTSKYTILKNGAYYVYHDWYQNHKERGGVAVTCPLYGHEGCSFKLVMQTSIYNILPGGKEEGF